MEGLSGVVVKKCVTIAAHLHCEHTLNSNSPRLADKYLNVWLTEKRDNERWIHLQFLNSIKNRTWGLECVCAVCWSKNHEICMLERKLRLLHKPSMMHHNPNTRCLCICWSCCDESSGWLYSMTTATYAWFYKMKRIYLGKEPPEVRHMHPQWIVYI